MSEDPERRVCRVSLRVSVRERGSIETASTRAGLCLSDYLRRILLSAPPLRAKRRPPLEAHLAAHLLVQLGAVTSQLRAIAARITAPLTPFVERDLLRALHELKECRIRIMRALGRRAGGA